MKKTDKKTGIKNYIYLLMLGHLSVDMNQGALPAALPFLIAFRGLNYTSATALVFASNISSSVVQPLFGHLGDKYARHWYISLGLILAGSGFAMVGLLNDYRAIFIAVMISGVGNAIFHPDGGRLSNQVSGENKSSSMSIFAVGGSLAFVVGPLLLSASVTNLGIRGTAVFFIPAFVIAAVSLVLIKNLQKKSENIISHTPAGTEEKTVTVTRQTDIQADLQADTQAGKDDWPAFVKLSVFVFFRSTVLAGMATFIPLYWVGVLKQTQAAGSMALAVYSVAAVFSTLIGGFLADRFGYNKIINICSFSFIPFLVLFTFIPDLRLSILLLIPMGFAIHLSFSTVIATGQAFIPNHIGFASGITIGMGVSVGGITAPVLGRISDLYDLTAAFYIIIILACLTAVTGCLIPKLRKYTL